MSEELEVSSTESASEETGTTGATSTPEINQDVPVNNLDDAKKVLEANAKQVKQQASSKKTAPTKTSSTGPAKAPDYQKQYQEIQTLVGKQSKELGELRKFYQENQGAIQSYKQFLSQQETLKMQGQLAEDPVAVMREIARREAQEQIAPAQQYYQEQASQAQAIQMDAGIREHLGSDYGIVAPVMSEILDGFIEMDKENGSTYAQELAQNPQILINMAAGKLAMQNRAQQAQQSQQAQVQKAQNLKTASGVAKSNTVSSSPVGALKDMPIDEMRAQMKKMGLLQ